MNRRTFFRFGLGAIPAAMIAPFAAWEALREPAPVAVLRIPKPDTAGLRDNLIELLESLRGERGIVLTEGDEIEFMQPRRRRGIPASRTTTARQLPISTSHGK